MVPSHSAIFGVDEIYKQPLCSNAARFIFEGQCDLQTLIRVIDETWLSVKCRNGKLKYPELQQYIGTFMGFLFWRKEQNFNVRNHVRLYDGKKPGNFINEKEVTEIWNELSQKPFDE